ATNATLVLTNVAPADAGSYLVVVSNSYGNSTSAPAQLTVVVPLPATIITPPTNQVATNGDTVQFAVTAQAASPLTYQWFFNQTNLLADATNDVLVLSNVSPSQAGTYGVLVTNGYGSDSNVATLVVLVLPTITCAPDQTVTLGATWDFVAPVATGSNI